MCFTQLILMFGIEPTIREQTLDIFFCQLGFKTYYRERIVRQIIVNFIKAVKLLDISPGIIVPLGK